MIDLGTLAGLHEHRHELEACCQHCDRWPVLPLAAMFAAGQGSRRVPLTGRCRDGGELGRL
jgi:hypothetical protein